MSIMNKGKLSNEERATQSPSTGAGGGALHSWIEETIFGKLESLDRSTRSLTDPLQFSVPQGKVEAAHGLLRNEEASSSGE